MAAIIRLAVLVAASAMFMASGIAEEPQPSPCASRHPMNDAWWTGPMLANTAATAPRGHYLLEPYLFDVTTQGSYSPHGARQSAPHANSYGSLTYLVYGLTNTWGVGLIPTFGYAQVSDGPGSSGVRMGDWTLQVQHRLSQFEPCRRVPTVSIAVQQTLPTGRYDRLGSRLSNGFGAGAYTTNVALYSQMYFWMPNRRILRMRLNVSEARSSTVTLKDASVYGTGSGFRGNAMPGDSQFVDAAWEYSVTRNWVLALDATYRHNGNTRVTGSYVAWAGVPQSPSPVLMNSGPSDAWGLAPAVEYNLSPTIGVLLGVRLIPAGRNTADTITPAIAINFVH